MFWRKKSQESEPETEKETYINFYIDDGLKVEFSYSSIEEFILLCDSVLNSKIRKSCIELIVVQLINGGLVKEADLFNRSINSTIKPSEYKI